MAGPKCRDQLGDGSSAYRVTPFGRDLAQRNQHERAVSHPRMRQFRIAMLDAPLIVDHVEIERARRIPWHRGLPSELGFDLVQHAKQFGRRKRVRTLATALMKGGSDGLGHAALGRNRTARSTVIPLAPSEAKAARNVSLGVPLTEGRLAPSAIRIIALPFRRNSSRPDQNGFIAHLR